MTMHQLHYTSCEDGLEGIQGFQISAMTPGAPKPLVELAVRASAYEAGPGLVTRVDGADLSTFPVAFGYIPSGPAATLFQSRYTGSDFTGRTGNYFAHALLLQDKERELRGALPIDMWRSPTWVHMRQNGTDLPKLDAIAPGGSTSPAAIRRFLSERGLTGSLASMVSAVQHVLSSGRGRVVLVVPDDQTAALWLAALCRSFPRTIGLDISFLTYTARPEDSGVLVSCTTPDVHLPAYGDFTVVDMTAGAAGDEPTRYAALLVRRWEAEDVMAALLPANQVSPPLAGEDLDAFAVLVDCADGSFTPPDVTETLLLDAAELAVTRAPGVLSETGWERFARLLEEAGGPVDLTRWAGLLQEMTRRRDTVPVDLLSGYYVAALSAPDRLWLPQLDETRLDHVATHSVLPVITGPGADVLLDRLAKHASLRDATARALERRLANQGELVQLVTTLAPRAAELIRQHRPGGQVAMLADLVLARAGREDRVAALSRAVNSGELDRAKLGSALWPVEPSTKEATHALRGLAVEILLHTGLLSRIVARVRHEVDRDELGPEHATLVDGLLAPPVAANLSQTDIAALKATKLIGHFRQATPRLESDTVVAEGLELHRTLPPNMGDRLLDGLAAFVLRADGARHRELLEASLTACGGRFLSMYKRNAFAKLTKATPNQVALVIVVWWSLPVARARKQLIDDTLATALERRRAKQLDKIGDLLKPTANKLNITAPRDGWAKWWKSWRSSHQQRTLLSRLGLRRHG